jgi:replicative DNA helicase
MMRDFKDSLAAADNGNPLINVEAEIGFIGDLIADNKLIDLAADRCRPIDFSVPLYGKIFAKMLEMSAAGQVANAVTLAPYFKDDENWPRTFGVLSAAELNAGPKARTKAYFDQITMLSSRRRMVAGLQDVIASVRNLDVTKEELVADADEAVAELAEQARSTFATAAEYAEIVIDSFGKPIVGVRCGIIASLDAVLGTLRPTNFVVLGGRPGMGKTGLVVSYSVGAASCGHGVLFYSLEMSGDELTRRILADMCYSPRGGVKYEHIRDGNVRGADLERVIAAKRRLDELPLIIEEAGGLTLSRFIRRTRSHKRRMAARGEKLELVVVDYIQLMAASRGNMSSYERVSEISMGLKQFALDEHVVVIGVAQLSRQLESRPDKRPIQSDLKDSGQLEQDADLICFVYREEEYLKHTKPQDEFGAKYEAWRTDYEAVRNKIEFLVRKRRAGPTGQGQGWFFGEYAAVRGADFFSNAGEDDYG